MIGTWRIGIWRRPEDFGSRYRGDPRRFSAYGLAGLWDAALGISLNGNDVSAIASQVAGGVDLPQATGANQPLYVGAPTYNGQPSIQFTAANADRLEASANIIAANPATFVLVMRDRTSATQGFFFGNSNSGATAGWSLGVRNTNLRDSVAVGVAARTDGTMQFTTPEVWVARDWAASSPAPDIWANGVQNTVATNVRTTPGASGIMTIGSLAGASSPADIDFLYGCVFTSAVDVSVVTRISHAMGARFGVAA